MFGNGPLLSPDDRASTVANLGVDAHVEQRRARVPTTMRATRLKFMLGAVAAFACQTATAAGCADDGRFALQPAIPIGPMTMRTHVVNTTACVQVTYATAATVGWTSIGFAQTPYMVNSPVKNVVVFDSASATTKLYLMASYESRNVPEQPGPMSITPVRGSVANGVISFTFERSLAAATEYDMALDPTGATCILWGYARRKWPDKHSDYGAVYITLSTSTLSDSDTIRPTDTPAIAAISFGIMVVLGLIVTYTTVGRGIVRKSLWAPRKHVSDVMPDPVTAGEAVIVLVYLGSMVVIALRVHRTFSDLDAKHLWCLIAGHVALQALVFLLLPVARGRHWEVAFGTSHDRVLKFHRWLGGFCVVPWEAQHGRTHQHVAVWSEQSPDIRRRHRVRPRRPRPRGRVVQLHVWL
ncbi:hypothetical protein DYB32_005325 [Aphanomyces invadans]|uniref:DOMON domain-containing protein n=1 Tax=Aphanomyces invadans TaxID=157072 RepID=A0A418AUV0_9STRA|nr:hypothetical protein DYB32_005325 [Aphanomyces invadans]